MTTDRVAGAALVALALMFSGRGLGVFKEGSEFAVFFEADARRLAEGGRKVGRIESK